LHAEKGGFYDKKTGASKGEAPCRKILDLIADGKIVLQKHLNRKGDIQAEKLICLYLSIFLFQERDQLAVGGSISKNKVNKCQKYKCQKEKTKFATEWVVIIR